MVSIVIFIASTLHDCLLTSARSDQPGCDHLTCDQMEEFFTPVLNQNFDMIRKCLEDDDQIEAIIAMGGFAKSQHFISRLKAEFGGVQRLRGTRADVKPVDFSKIHIQDGNETMIGFNHPVARGALLRHHEVAHRDLPTQDCFMIAEDAPWNPEQHGPRENHTIVKGEANPNEDWVKGLSKTIMPAGRRDVENAIWHVRHVGKNDTYQRLQLYWAAQAIKDGTPIFRKEGGGAKGQTVPGIMPCGIPVSYPLPDMHELAKQYHKFLKLQHPQHILQGQADETDENEDTEDTEFGASRTCSKRTPSNDQFSEPSKRRKTDQLRRAPAQKPRSCGNCGHEMTATFARSWADDICENCDAQAFYAIMIRVIVQYSGAEILLTVQMAKPDHFEAVEDGLHIGPEDVIELYRKSFIDSNFNPNALT